MNNWFLLAASFSSRTVTKSQFFYIEKTVWHVAIHPFSMFELTLLMEKNHTKSRMCSSAAKNVAEAAAKCRHLHESINLWTDMWIEKATFWLPFLIYRQKSKFNQRFMDYAQMYHSYGDDEHRQTSHSPSPLDSNEALMNDYSPRKLWRIYNVCFLSVC